MYNIYIYMDKLNFFIIIIFSVLIGLYIHFKYYNKLSKYNKSKFIYYFFLYQLCEFQNLEMLIRQLLLKVNKKILK